jgi:hemerythrin superfamily protein
MPNTVENVVAKVVGKSAAIEARLKGLKGVFLKLAEQHHEVGSLLARAESTEDFTTRATLWRQIRKELVSHEQAELLQIYPALSGLDAVSDIVAAHANDATEIETSIAEVDAIAVQTAEWKPALRRLIEKVTEHVELEESELFPKAQRALGADAAQKLEEPFERTKAMAAARLG